MIKALAHMVIMGLLLLSPALGWAQRSPVTHNFHSMSGDATKLKFENAYKTGITPLLTYTCSNNAVFGTYTDKITGLSKVSLNLPGNGDFVTTTAVDSLRGVTIGFYPSDKTRSNIELTLSRDSVHWSEPVTPDLMYNASGAIVANFVPGRYYVRLRNKVGNKATSLWYITYTFGDCNCVLYIPEE